MWRASDGDAREQEMSFWGWATLFFRKEYVFVSCMINEMHQHGNAANSRAVFERPEGNARFRSFISFVTQTSDASRSFMTGNFMEEAARWERAKNQFSRHAFETADRLWIIEQKCRGHVIPRLQFLSCSREDSRKMQSLTENKGELCNAQKPFRR